MSLINKMLQDLDARGGKPGAAPGQQELRPVNMPRKRLWPLLLGVGAVGVVVAAVGSWYGWHYFTKHTVKPRPAPVMVVVPQASAPTPAVAAAAPASSVGDNAASAPATATVAANDPAPAAPAAPAPQSGQRAHAREAKVHPTADRGGERPARHRSEQVKPQAKPAIQTDGAQAAGGVSRDLGPAQLAENRYRRALQDLQEGRTSEALAELQRAVELAPRHEAARQTLVTLLIENHRTDEAVQQLQQALALDHRQPDMAMLLARLQLESGGPALDTLMRTLPYAGDNAEYQGFVAGVLQRAQRHGEAVERYQAALKLAPQRGVWWMGLGISLQAEKRLPEARVAYTRAKAASGMTPQLQAFLDRKLEALGR